MNRKLSKIAGVLLPAATTLLGVLCGWLYFRYGGCAAGVCPIASNPWLVTGFGGVCGLLLGFLLRPDDGDRHPFEKAE